MRRLIISLLIMSALAISSAYAQDFPIISARARAMGGAFVALADDATCTYWNPAATPLRKVVDINAQFNARTAQTYDFLSDLDEIINLDISSNSESADELLGILNRLNDKSPFLYGGIDFGAFYTNDLFTSGYYESSIVFADLNLEFDHISTDPNNPDYIINNTSAVNYTRLKTKEYMIGIGYPLWSYDSFIGATVKYITVDIYRENRSLINDYSSGYNQIDFAFENFKANAADDSLISFDVGILFNLVSNFRLGVIGRNVLSPKIEISETESIKMNAQWRAGFAWLISEWLVITGDADITENKFFNSETKFRQIAFGVESSFFNKLLFIRAGANKNIADDNSEMVLCGGFGIRVDTVTVDIGGSYAPEKENLSAGIQLNISYPGV